MNTFLPFEDFRESARALHRLHLGKQRLEAAQLLRILGRFDLAPLHGRAEIGRRRKGWRNHPVTLAWTGYEPALAAYMNACILEWVSRGYVNTMPLAEVPSYVRPPWADDPRVHSAYRARLLEKIPEWYGTLGWAEAPSDQMHWGLLTAPFPAPLERLAA